MAHSFRWHYSAHYLVICLLKIQQHAQPFCPLPTKIWLNTTQYLFAATHVNLHPLKHTGKHTHSSYTIFLHRPLQVYPIDRSDADNMTKLCNILWRSTHKPRTVRHTNALTFILIILESQLMFLMQVSLNPVIYFYINIWSSLSVNCQLIFRPSSPLDSTGI